MAYLGAVCGTAKLAQRSWGARWFSGGAVSTRHFVHRALYAEGAGYFAGSDVVSAAPPMQFSSMLGSLEFRQRVAETYAATQQEWLTPSELFAPHWSHALAEYVVAAYTALTTAAASAAASGEVDLDGVPDTAGGALPPLHVFELGAGTGTNALHFCAYIAAYHPALYPYLRYTIVEISAPLAARQLALLRSAGHGGVATAVVASAADLSAGGVGTADPCFVLAQEVLDNLPQDKLVHESVVDGGAMEDRAPEERGPPDARLRLAQAAAEAAAAAGGPVTPLRAGHWHQTLVRPEGGDGVAWRAAMGDAAPPAGLRLPPLREVYTPLLDRWARAAGALALFTRPPAARRTPLRSLWGAAGDPFAPPATSGASRALAAARDWLYPEDDPSAVDAAMGRDLGAASAAYVPTTALQVLAALQLALPRHHLVAADFAALPPSGAPLPPLPPTGGPVPATGPADAPVAHFVPAVGEPLTASKPLPAGGAASAPDGSKPLSARTGGALVDHPTYLSPAAWGSADVYWSSDFTALQHMAGALAAAAPPPPRDGLHSRWEAALEAATAAAVTAGGVPPAAHASAVRSTAQFMAQYGRAILPRTRTLTGYNPLLHGYSNTAFLLADNTLA